MLLPDGRVLPGWDLLGAAAGCAVFPWVISRLGSVVGTALAAGLLGIPLVLLTVEWARGASGKVAAFGLSAAMGAAAFAGVYFARFVDPRPDSTKSLGFALNEQINPHVRREYSKWDAVTRLDIVSSVNGAPIDMGWAKFDPNDKLVTFDGDAISVIRRRSRDFPSASEVAEFRAGSPEMPFLEKAVGGEHLIIGLGGGLDIEDSLKLDARSITGVDVNAAIITAMKGPYANFSVRIFLRPNVKVVHSEGRAYLRGINERFDLIRMRGVDTFAALSTGAYVLAENYLYTVEALREYFRHLNGHGVLCVQRWFDGEKPGKPSGWSRWRWKLCGRRAWRIRRSTLPFFDLPPTG